MAEKEMKVTVTMGAEKRRPCLGQWITMVVSTLDEAKSLLLEQCPFCRG